MNVIGICGSPRKGNTEWMLEIILQRFAQKGAIIELILLRKKKIKSCTGCLKCEDRRGKCVLEDDMQDIFPGLLSADCIVMGTPVYFEMVSGQLKTFMDRTCPVWTKMGGKLMLGTAVAEEGIGNAIQDLKTYSKVCGMQWVGAVSALAKTPGQVAEDRAIKRKLNRLADKAFKLFNQHR